MRVHVKIKEGDKERVQVYAGTVIARDVAAAPTRRSPSGASPSAKASSACSRIPHAAKVEVERSGVTRRAKLYYMRKLTSKQSRLKEVQE